MGKVSASNVGDPGLIPGLGRCPGEGNGNPLEYSCLEGVAKSQTRLSDFTSLLPSLAFGSSLNHSGILFYHDIYLSGSIT